MKKLVLMAVVALVAVSTKAEFLYFQANAFNWEKTSDYLFDYAMVGVALKGWDGTGEKTYLLVQPKSGGTWDYYLATDDDGTGSGEGDNYHATGIANITGYTNPDDNYVFYVETYKSDLVSGDDTLLWTYSPDTALTYEELYNAGHVSGDTSGTLITPWVVPEPTSGLLLLMGLAGLALRRRTRLMA